MGPPADELSHQDGYAILTAIADHHRGWSPYLDPATGKWTASSPHTPPVTAGDLPGLLAALDEVNQ